MSSAKYLLPLMIAFTPAISGCGLYVPKAHEFYEAESDDTAFVNLIINNIKCELHRGAQITLASLDNPVNKRVDWLRTWGAGVDLEISTEEDGSLGTGLSWKPPPPFSLGLGLGASAKATRDEHISTTYAFQDLLNEGDIQGKCDQENGILIQSDLDIGNFIFQHIWLTLVPGTLPKDQNVLYQTLKYTVTFVATYNANITPTWTFKHTTVNPSGNLFSANRTKTTTLLITMSKSTQGTPDKPAELYPEGVIVRNAALIGQAVSQAQH